MADTSPKAPNPFIKCEHCGYSLQGASEPGRCPECGKEFGDELVIFNQIMLFHPFNIWLTTAVVLGFMCMVGLASISWSGICIYRKVTGRQLFLYCSPACRRSPYSRGRSFHGIEKRGYHRCAFGRIDCNSYLPARRCSKFRAPRSSTARCVGYWGRFGSFDLTAFIRLRSDRDS